jgi:uncharacterized protein YuzE
MSKRKEPVGFELSVSGRGDGTIEAAYVCLSKKKVARTREIVEDVLLADYDAEGQLVGIEILAPIKAAQIVRLVQQPQRAPFLKFLRQSAPQELIHA